MPSPCGFGFSLAIRRSPGVSCPVAVRGAEWGILVTRPGGVGFLGSCSLLGRPPCLKPVPVCTQHSVIKGIWVNLCR